MIWLVLCLVASSVQSVPSTKLKHVADVPFLKKQVETMLLYFHVEETNHVEGCNNISATWDPSLHIEDYNNIHAVQEWTSIYLANEFLPRHISFSPLEKSYTREVQNLFNMLYSAKDYETFYKTACFARDRTNEELFIYVLTAVILHRTDLQSIFIPPLFEVLSEYYNNGEIINIAQKINVLGDSIINDHHRSVYKRDNDFIIRWNNTVWPYSSKSASLTYFTQDPGLSLFYYYFNMGYPTWLSSDVVPLNVDRRGEWFWFMHKQIVTRYYMERLSNGLGEIDDLDDEIVEEGFNSGLVYPSGTPFPTRANYFSLNQPDIVHKVLEIKEYERRIRDAIDSGFYINNDGKLVEIRSEEAINILGNLVEANVDSPNRNYYKDFITLWKSVLGNSVTSDHGDNSLPFVLPSALEHYQIALRDPAFFMIWKRVLKLFSSWQQKLNPYSNEELLLPGVSIKNVEVDELVTYFDHSYMNISAVMPMNDKERKWNFDDASILVEYPRLNHQNFGVRIHVESEVAKKVAVVFGMAPKYDSRGRKIPLDENWQNVFVWDEFIYDLPEGESVIVRKSINNNNIREDWNVADDVYHSAKKAIDGKEKFYFDKLSPKHLFPGRLLLPKGTVGGMPFVFMVYIGEYRPPPVSYGSSFDATISSGYGSGSRKLTGYTLGFPFNRPFVSGILPPVMNLHIKDIVIRHKPSRDVFVPFTDNVMLNFPRVDI